MVSLLNPLLLLVREIFARGQPRRSGKSRSDPPTDLFHQPKRGGGRRRAKAGPGSAPDNVPKKSPLQDQGNRLLMAVSHPVEEGCRQKVKNSIGERVIRLPKAAYYPSSTFQPFFQPLLSCVNTRFVFSPFTLSNHRTARRPPDTLGFRGGSRALVRSHVGDILRTLDPRAPSRRP
jgi:hypothetical protein